MNAALFGLGIFLLVGGLLVLAFIHFVPESVRREKRRVRNLEQRAREAGLRGRYVFVADRSKWDTPDGFGTYQSADEEDRALYAAVSSRIESDSSFFARSALWSDVRLKWVGVPALLVGIAACAAAAVG